MSNELLLRTAYSYTAMGIEFLGGGGSVVLPPQPFRRSQFLGLPHGLSHYPGNCLGTDGLHELLVSDLAPKVTTRAIYKQPRQSTCVFFGEVDPRQSLLGGQRGFGLREHFGK